MATIGSNFNKSQIAQQARVRADMNTVDSKEASHAAQTGASGTVAKQAKSKKKDASKALGEKSFLSEAAQKALDKAEAADTEKDAHKANLKENAADVADDIALRNKTKKRGEDDDDKKVGTGEVEQKKSARVFALDDDGAEAYEVTETQGKKMDSMDGKTPEQILAGMPEGAKQASKATLDTQIKTKGTEKVAELKDNPKVTAVAEKLDLDLAESLKESAVIAPIHTAKNTPIEPTINPNDEKLAKEAAIRQMQANGGGEAMIAS